MAKRAYLLDTHCLIWFQENNSRLPIRVMQKIQHPGNDIIFSQVSLFEIAIKKAIGKLPNFLSTISEVYDTAIADGFFFLPINNKHLESYANVPLLDIHRDPFDRLLIATALEESAVILSVDSNFKLYDSVISVEW